MDRVGMHCGGHVLAETRKMKDATNRRLSANFWSRVQVNYKQKQYGLVVDRWKSVAERLVSKRNLHESYRCCLNPFFERRVQARARGGRSRIFNCVHIFRLCSKSFQN